MKLAILHYLTQLGEGLAGVVVISVASLLYSYFNQASTMFFTDQKIHK